MTQLDDLSGRGALAKHLLDRIARDEVNHQENQCKNEPERWKGKKESVQQMARH
jgi:hypothetical protein